MFRSLALLAAVSIASSGEAASLDDNATRVIPYEDRFYSDDGLTDLRQQMGAAANQVCADPTGPSPGPAVDAVCRSDAMRNASAQLNQIMARRHPKLASFANPR